MEFGTGTGVKKLERWGYRAEKEVTISSAIWIQCTNLMDRADGQTDRQTDTGRQQRPRLRIASRGKIGQHLPTLSARIKYLLFGLTRYSLCVNAYSVKGQSQICMCTCTASGACPCMYYAVVTTTIRLRFDSRSTGVRLLIKGH